MNAMPVTISVIVNRRSTSMPCCDATGGSHQTRRAHSREPTPPASTTTRMMSPRRLPTCCDSVDGGSSAITGSYYSRPETTPAQRSRRRNGERRSAALRPSCCRALRCRSGRGGSAVSPVESPSRFPRRSKQGQEDTVNAVVAGDFPGQDQEHGDDEQQRV